MPGTGRSLIEELQERAKELQCLYRVHAICARTEAPLDELQALADSEDRQKRERGRRGLEVLQRLQANPYIDLEIEGLRGGEPEGTR